MSFTKEHAESSAKKLKTKPKDNNLPRLEVLELKDGAHVVQQIWCNGKFVNKFGIKHAARRDNSHGWVARDLDLSPTRMRDFALCHMPIDEMIQHFVDQGLIELPDTQNEEQAEP